jgi:hypothetical protein
LGRGISLPIDAADLTDVLVIGEDAKGVIRVASSGNIDIAQAMLLMERAKQHLLAIYPTYEKNPPNAQSCLSLRNQYAHCHWTDTEAGGLFFTNLEKAASGPVGFNYEWR